MKVLCIFKILYAPNYLFSFSWGFHSHIVLTKPHTSPNVYIGFQDSNSVHAPLVPGSANAADWLQSSQCADRRQSIAWGHCCQPWKPKMGVFGVAATHQRWQIWAWFQTIQNFIIIAYGFCKLYDNLHNTHSLIYHTSTAQSTKPLCSSPNKWVSNAQGD